MNKGSIGTFFTLACIALSGIIPDLANGLACTSYFSSAAQNHDKKGKIELKKNAQILGDSDSVLETTELKNEGGAKSCGTTTCKKSGNPSPAFDPVAFKKTNSNHKVDTSGTFILGSDGTNAYEEIKLDKNSVLNDNGAYPEYFIKKLVIEKNSVVKLRAGTDYWIGDFDLKDNSEVNIIGEGTVRLFIEKDFKIKKNVEINSPSAKHAGSAEKLFIYSFGKVVLETNATLSALVYADSEIELKENSNLFGAASAGKLIKLEKNATITHQENAAAAADIGSLCEGGGSALDHLRILHDGQAITCAPEQVTIRACKNIGCDELYAETVTVDLIPSGWVGGDTVSITGGEITLGLRHTTPGVVTLGAFSPTADKPARCFIGANESCVMSFAESGFIFDVPDLTACESSTDISIQAVKKSDSGISCAPAISGTKTINFWSSYSDPSNGTRNLFVNGLPVNSSSPGSGIDLAFDANARATLTTTYYDAGRMQLNAEYQGTGDETGLLLEGNDQFVSRPHSLYASATTDGSTQLNNAHWSGEPKWKAGVDFRMQLRGQCADGTLLPNYLPTNTAIWLEMTTPSAGTVGTLTLRGNDYLASYAENWLNISALFSDGVVVESVQDTSDPSSYTLASFSEVGSFTTHLRDDNYMGQPIGPTISAVVGRFYPADFRVTVSDHGAMAPACNGYTYSGQTMWYASTPEVLVTARNASGLVTRNYTGNLNKLKTGTGSSINFSGPSSDASQMGKDESNLTSLSASLNSNLANIIDNGNGTLNYSLSTLDEFTYTRNDNAEITPYTSNIGLTLISVIDGDGVRDDGTSIILDPSGSEIRFGRLVMDDAYGPQTDQLLVRIRAEYLADSGFIDNTDDYCTLITPTTAVSLSNWQNNLSNGETSVSSSSGLLAGSGEILLSAPGVGAGNDTNDGTVDLTLNLSTTSPLQTWLLNDENGDGVYSENPVGTASFGMYRGDDRFLYWRETQ